MFPVEIRVCMDLLRYQLIFGVWLFYGSRGCVLLGTLAYWGRRGLI